MIGSVLVFCFSFWSLSAYFFSSGEHPVSVFSVNLSLTTIDLRNEKSVIQKIQSYVMYVFFSPVGTVNCFNNSLESTPVKSRHYNDCHDICNIRGYVWKNTPPPLKKYPPPSKSGSRLIRGGIFSSISDSRRVPPSGRDLAPRSGEIFEKSLSK